LLFASRNVVAADTFSMTPFALKSLKNVVTPVIVAPPPTTLRPDLAVTRPMESTLVTSSYVNTPLKVAATPVILLAHKKRPPSLLLGGREVLVVNQKI